MEYVLFERVKLVFYLVFEWDLCRLYRAGNEQSRKVGIHRYYLMSGNICLVESLVGRRVFDGDGERGIVFVELTREFVGDGNHYEFEIYFVVEDYIVEDRVYYLFFDLMTDFDFDFVGDTDDHLFLVIDPSFVNRLLDEMGRLNEDVNDLSNRIEAQDCVHGI